MSLNRRFYVLVGRVLSPFALLGLKLYTLLTNRPRVRVLVTDEQGDVLLIKGIISKHGWWTLPGGGVERHERLAHAAKRELYEETGMVKPLEAFTHLRTIPKAELGLGFVAPLFHIVVQRADLSAEQYNPTEVAAIDWFSPDALPTDTAPLVRTALAEYHAQKASKN